MIRLSMDAPSDKDRRKQQGYGFGGLSPAAERLTPAGSVSERARPGNVRQGCAVFTEQMAKSGMHPQRNEIAMLTTGWTGCRNRDVAAVRRRRIDDGGTAEMFDELHASL